MEAGEPPRRPAPREASRASALALSGGLVAIAVVIVGADKPLVIISAVIGLLILLVLHAKMISRKASVRSRLDAILDKCLARKKP